MRVTLIALSLAVSSGAARDAQLPGDAREAVATYRAALASAKAGHAPHALEAALSALAKVRGSLVREAGTRPGTVLESLSEADFAQLQHDLEGAVVNREETIYVEADPDYFGRLAAAHGDQAGRAFFAARKRTYPTGVWPVYVERQTDSSGCTIFGRGTLVEIFRLWFDFQRSYPVRYVKEADAERVRVGEELTASTCACGDEASVQRELDQFLRQVPSSPLRPAVEQRLKAVRTARSTVRFRCSSGE